VKFSPGVHPLMVRVTNRLRRRFVCYRSVCFRFWYESYPLWYL